MILDDYLVEGELGRGGMGIVYRVRSRSLGQRFAVKTARFRDISSRLNFLTELQAWMDLPPHPHLAACHFFRTAADQMAIFAELVEGGSLADWITARRLGGLGQLLDVAIQVAWGLHAAHTLGLVHQDVKPGNVLMTADGTARVTDFGLSRARMAGGVGSGDSRVTFRGMTAAYCSPEQAAHGRLDHRTDVWSWGLTVLELFTGGATWMAGVAAAEVLEDHLGESGADARLPPIPAGAADVLRRCFRHAPQERWPTLAEAAGALVAVYCDAVGRDYPRRVPALPGTRGPDHDAVLAEALPRRDWDDPRVWLLVALVNEGRDPMEARRLLPRPGGGGRGRALDDLALFERAQDSLERLVAGGRTDLEEWLISLFTAKALVHDHLGDYHGVAAAADRGIQLCEGQVRPEDRQEFRVPLAKAYGQKARAAMELGDQHLARNLLRRAAHLYEQLVRLPVPAELLDELASLYVWMADLDRGVADDGAVLRLYDRAIQIREELSSQGAGGDLRGQLATAYMNKANFAVGALADRRLALDLYDQAIALWEELVCREQQPQPVGDLAAAYMNKAAALSDAGSREDALVLFDKAIAVLERVAGHGPSADAACVLADAYTNKAKLVTLLGDPRAAQALYDRAVDVFDRLVRREGLRELRGRMAIALVQRGLARMLTLNLEEGRREIAEAVAVLEEEVRRTRRPELEAALAWARSILG